MRPEGNFIAEKFYPCHHNYPFIKAKEETAMDFLADYVKNMDSEDASLFMKYITGLDVFKSSVHVDFNGVDVDEMVPSATTTCTQTLQLSRYVTPQNQFNELMEVALGAADYWQFHMICFFLKRGRSRFYFIDFIISVHLEFQHRYACVTFLEFQVTIYFNL